jgi:hypothetical protein
MIVTRERQAEMSVARGRRIAGSVALSRLLAVVLVLILISLPG